MADDDIWVAVLGLACERFGGGTSQLLGASILAAVWRCSVFFCCGHVSGCFRGGSLFVEALSQQWMWALRPHICSPLRVEWAEEVVICLLI